MDNKNEARELILIQHILEILLSISRKLKKRDNGYCKELTASQYMIILAARLSPKGEATAASIASRLGTTKQNTSRIIPVLERKGYISRAPCVSNRHASNIKVTDSGLDAALKYMGANAFALTELFSGFTEGELEVLWMFLRRLHDCNDENHSGIEAEAMDLLEHEYPGLMLRVLEEYRKGSARNKRAASPVQP